MSVSCFPDDPSREVCVCRELQKRSERGRFRDPASEQHMLIEHTIFDMAPIETRCISWKQVWYMFHSYASYA